MCVKSHHNHSLFTQFSLHYFILIFTVIVFFFEIIAINYRTEAVVCKDVLKATLQHTVIKSMQ